MTVLEQTSEVDGQRSRHATPADRLSVVHVVLSLQTGGLERVVTDLVGEERALGQRVAVVTLSDRGELASTVEAAGVPVICAHKPAGLRFKTTQDLAAIFGKLRPDVVHTHQIGALFYAGPAARRAGVPLVVHTEHGKHYDRFRTRWLGRLASRHAARVFCVSQDLASHMLLHRVVQPSKVLVVVNGIDTNRFNRQGEGSKLRQTLGVPCDAPVVGTIGRLTEVKRQDSLIRAFVAVRQRVPEAHLLIVGDGPLMAELRGLAAELGVEQAVHFPGYQPQPERYLQVMDVFALSSRSEGMPLVLLEAGAMGLPVVAMRVGGVPEVIVQGHTGLLVAPGDEAALATALSELLADVPLAQRMGTAARERVLSTFSLSRMAGEYQQQYQELLRSR